MRYRSFLCAASLLILSACGAGDDPRRGAEAADALFANGFASPILDRRGQQVGTVRGRPDKKGLVVLVESRGLPAGTHGIHLHEAGRCEPPVFGSAGAHWNAAGREHGHDNPNGPHDGDLGNIGVEADGGGSAERLIPRWHGKIPAAGLSLIIHADPDDERTDPSGNSGERIACAVVMARG